MKKQLLLLVALFFCIQFNYSQVVSMIGTTSPSGSWGVDTDMTTTDNITYTLNNVVITAATPSDPNSGLKFRQDHDWPINWGSAAFPTGTGVQNGANILTLAGTYNVTFNRTTGAYNFDGVSTVIPTIAIVGPATGGWPSDPQVDANPLTSSDGITYRSNSVTMTAAAFKFRQDNSWTVSWGGLTFPTGPASGNETNDIVATAAGNYRVIFNRTTGAYAFDFPGIAIVGEAVGGWPGEPGNPGPTDVHQMTTTDGETYIITNLQVTDAIPSGGAKFRQDNSWTISWGHDSFPTGTFSNGANIPTVAGTYDVTFTRSTGAYTFTPSLATTTFSKTNFKVYPNPTANNWNFVSSNETITSIEVYDILGKRIALKAPNDLNVSIDTTGLNQGVYFAKIETASSKETIKVLKY